MLSVGGVAAVVSAKSSALLWKIGAVIAERELVSDCFRVHLHGILPDSEFYSLDAAAAGINENESERKKERCFIHH